MYFYQPEPKKNRAGVFECRCSNHIRLIYPCCIVACPICYSVYSGIWVTNKKNNEINLQSDKLSRQKFISY